MKNLKMIDMSNLAKLCSCMIVGSSLLLSACGDGGYNIDDNTSSSFTNDEFNSFLKSTKWTLQGANDGQKIIPELENIKNQVTLSFSNRNNQPTFGFTVGCNLHGASYSLSGDNLFSAEPAMGTEKYCTDLDKAENLLEKFFRKDIKISVSNATGMQTLNMVGDDKTALTWTRK